MSTLIEDPFLPEILGGRKEVSVDTYKGIVEIRIEYDGHGLVINLN